MMRLRYSRLAAEMRELHREIARAHARLDDYDAGWTALVRATAGPGDIEHAEARGHDAAPPVGDES